MSCSGGARAVLLFSPHHGSEGTQHKVCFSAQLVQTDIVLPRACALLQVQRCAVCIGGPVLPGAPPLMSLLDVSKQLLGDTNWIRVWLVRRASFVFYGCSIGVVSFVLFHY